jgi:hypothetical protein
VLERCSHSFRLFLRAAGEKVCPFCTVIATLEREHFDQWKPTVVQRDRMALCGRHFQLALKIVAEHDTRARANLVRAVIASDMGESGSLRMPSCEICDSIEAAMRGLVVAVRSLDNRIRFGKVLERAPLFCRRHAADVCTGKRAPNFARVQYGKLKRITDELSQALLRHSDNLDQLIENALTYVEGSQASRADSKGGAPLEHPGMKRRPSRRAASSNNGTTSRSLSI